MMICPQTQPLLSAYRDGELEDEQLREMQQHLSECGDCRDWLDRIERAGRILAQGRHCETPHDIWYRIEAEVIAAGGQRTRGMLRHLAAAAVLGVATFGTSYWVTSDMFNTPESQVPVQTAFGLALGVYVQELQEGKTVANQFMRIHQGHEVSPDQLVQQVGFTPLLPSELPDGFMLDKSYVLATTCCRAIQLHYIKGTELVTVFQQGQGHPVLFDFDDDTTDIAGVSCRTSKVNGIFVINWDGEGRNTTLLISVHLPTNEIESLVGVLASRK